MRNWFIQRLKRSKPCRSQRIWFGAMPKLSNRVVTKPMRRTAHRQLALERLFAGELPLRPPGPACGLEDHLIFGVACAVHEVEMFGMLTHRYAFRMGMQVEVLGRIVAP